MRIDLDAARAARLEGRQEAHSFVHLGEEFALPVELPAEFAFILALDGDTRKAMEYLLGEEWERFRALRPSYQDMEELAKGIASAYGFDTMGESSASPVSSPNGGSRSRPTLPATTRSTSERRVGATAKRR